MCLAIPGRVVEIFEEGGLTMGRIDYAGAENTACLAYVPEVEVGQYVLVHAGFALQVVDEEEARRSLELLTELNAHLEADLRADGGAGEAADGTPADGNRGGAS
jgi:hydrogenase assembly chaperone HypC/HupF